MVAAPQASPAARGLRISVMMSVRDETDAAGRLLLEDSAPKQARRLVERNGVAMKSVPCPFTDTPSRMGGRMNVSAYEAVRLDLGPVLDGFAWLCRHYYGLEPGNRSNVQGLLDVSNLALSVPLVLLHRADDPIPPHGSMPTFVASIFKAGRGVFTAAVDMLNASGPVPTTGAEVVRFADEHRHLMRQQTRRSCAGPTRLIERTLDVILTGAGGDPDRSRLGELVRFGDLWRFYTLQETFNSAVNRYRHSLDQLVRQAGTNDREALFQITVENAGRRFTFGAFTDGFVEHVNSLQNELNEALGRGADAPTLSLDDVVALL